MSKIIQIEALYDNYRDMVFGFVGIDLETKERRYYSYYNYKNEYNRQTLYEFNPPNMVPGSFISKHMHHCRYKVSSLDNKLPKELFKLLPDYINHHKKYNIDNNFPTDNIDENLINLSMKYMGGNLLIFDKRMASYTPFQNEIEIAVDKTDWKGLSSKQKENIRCSLIHEIGHMKVSNYKFDETKNTILVKTGFYVNEIKLWPIVLENGDIFYKITRVPNKWDNRNERALEEIINDLDCSLAFSSFSGNYPKLGKELNDLCDKKLTFARYNIGIEQLYASLEEIINDYDLAHELLECIGDCIYGYDTEKSEEQAKQLIKKYEGKKFG